MRRLPGSSLDRNPVLWREWQRKRPSRWVRLSWAAYIILAGSFGVAAMVIVQRKTLPGLAVIVNAFQVSIGLLLVSIGSVTALAEERACLSLELLLATPLETRTIVWGKWWGAYRPVLLLAVWPALVAAVACDGGHPAAAILLACLVLAYGAAITSMGLLLATWVQQLSRAMALAVTGYIAVAVGWVFMVAMLSDGGIDRGLNCASPFFGVGLLTEEMERPFFGSSRLMNVVIWDVLWTAVYVVVAAGLLWLTLATFDRRLGRMSNRLRKSGSQRPSPRPARADVVLFADRQA
jgi:ABC-type transport system involved in multi-copper enzyme maturation permease subunit